VNQGSYEPPIKRQSSRNDGTLFLEQEFFVLQHKKLQSRAGVQESNRTMMKKAFKPGQRKNYMR
jgi:hypothetical protein